MQQFEFRLLDGQGGKVGSATLTLADELAARLEAAIHLSASPSFHLVEISQAKEVVFTVDRKELDSLGRPLFNGARGYASGDRRAADNPVV